MKNLKNILPDEGKLADVKLLKHRKKDKQAVRWKKSQRVHGFIKPYYGEVEFTGEIKGLERQTGGLKRAALQRTWVYFLGRTWWLTTLPNSRPGGHTFSSGTMGTKYTHMHVHADNHLYVF